MEVKYVDNRLQKLCTDEREMQRKRGDIAKKLKLRLNDLRLATHVGHLPELSPKGGWHPVKKKFPGHWAGEVSYNERIVIRPEGSANLLTCTTVTVTFIGDYHDN